jgi:hypothetical protein
LPIIAFAYRRLIALAYETQLRSTIEKNPEACSNTNPNLKRERVGAHFHSGVMRASLPRRLCSAIDADDMRALLIANDN